MWGFHFLTFLHEMSDLLANDELALGLDVKNTTQLYMKLW